MIDFGKTTRAFSTAEQTSSLKPDNNQTLSAEDKAKLLGDNKNVGEYLNKLADPNYVDPSRLKRVGKNQLGKDDFLKLMLAQLKHQDPTSPMESHQMASQMAQFSSLEQLSNINKGIGALAGGQSSGGTYDALTFIGKVASGDSSVIQRNADDEGHEFNFKLLGDASKVKVKVTDESGNLVKTLEVNNLKKGKNTVSWNGITEDGLQAREGQYRFQIEASSANNKKIHAETKFEGKISGVRFTPSGPVLMLGKQTIALRDVQQIVDPQFLQQDKSKKSPGLDLKKNVAVGQTDIAAKQMAKGNIDNVPMERGLINKLSKLK